jgi:DNA-directed RNA polymerase subunit RPC12/RpoP
MARPTNDVENMAPFFNWLVRTGEKSPGTAKVYASGVRQILRELGDRAFVDTAVQAYFENLREEKPSAYSSRLSSYNAWCDYRETALEEPDVIRVQGRKGTPKDTELPPEVCQALRTLKNESRIAFRTLFLMTWEDVEFLPGARGDFYHIRDPTQKGVSFRADADAIDVLMKWGKPLSEGLPLLPRAPGSDQAYAVKGMRREATKGQETLMERVARLRLAERAKPVVPEGVTPQNYTSKYLPKVDETESVEDLLGVDRSHAGRQKRIQEAHNQASAEFRALPIEAKKQRMIEAGALEPETGTPESNDLPRPEGAGVPLFSPAIEDALGPRSDAHNHTASRIFGTEEPTPEQRDVGKKVNFATKYGRHHTVPSGHHSAESIHWADPTTWPNTCPTCVQGFENPIGHDGVHCDDCAERVAVRERMDEHNAKVQGLQTAAALLGVDADKLEALMALLRSTEPAVEEPEPEPEEENQEPRSGIVNLAELRDRLTTEEAEAHTRIKEKGPVVGDDGLLYDPNDPDYADYGEDS